MKIVADAKSRGCGTQCGKNDTNIDIFDRWAIGCDEWTRGGDDTLINVSSMISNYVIYIALSYVFGSFELIEPTLPAFSKPALVTYLLNPPSKGGLGEAVGFA